MRVETKTTYIADDGTRFTDEKACRKYEAKLAEFRATMITKIGEYAEGELFLGGHARLDSLPFRAPWLSPYGACFINVTDVRRVNGVVEFQLADERSVPYGDGNEWCKAEQFYSEWPD